MANRYKDKYGNTFTNFSGDGNATGKAPANIPIDKQSLGITRDNAKPELPAGMEKQWYPGIGLLGPDLEGAVRGTQMQQDFQMKNAANARAEEDLGIRKENLGIQKDYLSIAQEDLGIRKEDLGIRKSDSLMRQKAFGYKENEIMKQKMIDSGMQEASQAGGYSGVIDFLKGADPTRAIAFHADKLKLDAQMMTTDVMRATAPSKMLEAQVEGYGVLGKFGQAILSAPEEQQQAMYDHVLPMVRQVNPDAPKNVKDATGMFMLASSQAMPSNQLFGSTLGGTKAQSNVAKLDADYQAGVKAGLSSNDPRQLALAANRDMYVEKAQISSFQKVAAEMKIQSTTLQNDTTRFNNTQKVQKEVDTASKDYNTYMDLSTRLKTQFDILTQDVNNPAAQGAVSRLMASMVQKGILTDRDVSETVHSDAGWNAIMNNYGTPWSKGELVNLSPNEIKNLSTVFNSVDGALSNRQTALEKKYSEKIAGYGDVIRKDQIIMPSSIYEQKGADKSLDRIIKTNGLENYSPEIQKQAAEAIDSGVSPALVKLRLSKQQQAPQQ